VGSGRGGGRLRQWSIDQRRPSHPVRTKTVRDFSENLAGPARPLGCLVGRLNVAPGEKVEQLVAGVDDTAVSQMAAVRVGRLEFEEAVEFALECARAYDLMVESARLGRRRPISQARCKNCLNGGANTVSLASKAYCASRIKWARQN